VSQVHCGPRRIRSLTPGSSDPSSFIHHELDDAPFIKPATIKMRVISPKDSEIYRPWYITQADVASIIALKENRDKKFGPGGHIKTVTELPDEVRGAEAIPAVMTEILHQLDKGRSLDELRKRGMPEIGDWRIDVTY
jgi:hypothetical protein